MASGIQVSIRDELIDCAESGPKQYNVNYVHNL